MQQSRKSVIKIPRGHYELQISLVCCKPILMNQSFLSFYLNSTHDTSKNIFSVGWRNLNDR
jgi:hypothetical protein